MTALPRIFERLQENKREIALPSMGFAVAIVILSLFLLDHEASFSYLKGLFLALEAAVVALAISIRSIRLAVCGMVALFVVSGM
jgi:hypothetical protein